MKVVVVGGGFGGVKTALELANRPDFKVALVSQTENFEYHGALYRSGTGRSPLEVVIPLRDIFTPAKNVEVILDKIVGLDSTKQRLVSETGNIYPYDKVVFAMGNVVNYFGISGLDTATMSLDTIANTIALRHRLSDLFRSEVPQVRIAVIGGGPAGVELAGELHHFAQLVAEKYQVTPKKVEVILIEGGDRILPTLQPLTSAKAHERLKKLGVKIKTNTRLNACEPGKVCLDSGDLMADLIVWTAGSRAAGFYNEHPETFEMERGRVKVDQYLHAVGQTDIYVIGDNASTPFSGMAQTALHDAKFVAGNLNREQNGQSPLWYQAMHPIYVVPIGPSWAVLQTANGVVSGYRGWRVRRRNDLAIYRNFEPYKKAIKTWRKGNKFAQF